MSGTFITIGNATNRFDRFFSVIQECWSCLPRPIIVQKGTGQYKLPHCEEYDFLSPDEFERSLLTTDLILMHSGAGSIIRANRLGRVPLVMPRRRIFGEHINDHQVDFTAAMVSSGRVLKFEDAFELKRGIPVAMSASLDRLSSSPLVEEIDVLLLNIAENGN